MVAFTVRVLENHLPQADAAIERAVEREIQASALRIQAGAMVRTPVLTGTLRRGWATQQVPDGWRVYNPVNYAPYLEWGTRYIAPRGMLTQAVAQERSRLVANLSRAIKASVT